MTLQEILQAVEQLTPDELEKLTEFVQRRRKGNQSVITDSELKTQLNNIFVDAQPVEIKAGTLDFDEFMRGIDLMRQNLSQTTLNEIADAIEAETPVFDDFADD